ncbi:MAG TPA: TadE/TadG family type IV pilus assembly protein [Symbiobacteriaceae bacterium]|nr:TadE/TadG family type IV pilus assembly protein [Symbiobacteriaceae bacterium]
MRFLRRESGSAVTEFAIVAPVLILLVIGGWIVIDVARSKMALAMTAGRIARDLAGSPEMQYALFESGLKNADTEKPAEVPKYAYRFEGFSESFGLPRHRVHAVVTYQPVDDLNEAVVVAACYRIPLLMPAFDFTPAKPYLPDTSDEEEFVDDVAILIDSDELRDGLAQYRETKSELEYEIGAWERVWKNAVGLLDDVKRIFAKTEGLAGGLHEFAYPEEDLKKPRQIPKGGLESAAAKLCQPNWKLKGQAPQGIVVTSRAAFLREKERMDKWDDSGSAVGR